MQTTSVVFDFDGTLIDSKPGIIRCLKSVSAIYGLDSGCIDDAVIGPPAGETIRRLMPNHSSEVRGDFLKAFRECYAHHGWSECSLYPGINELLEDLRDGGARIFICTSKREDLTLRLLDHFNLRRYFEAVAADRDELSSHEKGDLLASLIEAEGIDAASGFMVGDSKFDLNAARSNGMNTIGVLYGYGKEEELVAQKPDGLCETPAAIYHFIESVGALG